MLSDLFTIFSFLFLVAITILSIYKKITKKNYTYVKLSGKELEKEKIRFKKAKKPLSSEHAENLTETDMKAIKKAKKNHRMRKVQRVPNRRDDSHLDDFDYDFD